MNALMFTHGSDIDGLGCAVLMQKAFSNSRYIPCEHNNVNENFLKLLESGDVHNYDKIFITDITLSKDVMKMIYEDEKYASIREKILTFDHHGEDIGHGITNYNKKTDEFTNEKGEKETKKTCGTSLFYKYLVANEILTETQQTKEFDELTRMFDTFDDENPKFKKSEDLAFYLNALCKVLGADEGRKTYIADMLEKTNNTDKEFCLTEEQGLIEEYRQYAIEIFAREKDSMKELDIKGANVGLFENVPPELVTVLPIYMGKLGADIDAVGVPNYEKDRLSLRIVKKEKPNPDEVTIDIAKQVNLAVIADSLGGGGHPGAASAPLLNIHGLPSSILEKRQAPTPSQERTNI